MSSVWLRFYSLLVCIFLSKFGNTQGVGFNIIQQRCTPCHHKQGIAPFDFNDPEVIRYNLTNIYKNVESKNMPLWFAEEQSHNFYNNRSLSDEERNSLLSWINEVKNGQIVLGAGGKPYSKVFLDTAHIKPMSLSFLTTHSFDSLNDKIFVHFHSIEQPLPSFLKGVSLSFSEKDGIHHAVAYGINNDSPYYDRLKGRINSQIEENIVGGATLGVYAPGVNYALLPEGFGFKSSNATGFIIEKHLLNLEPMDSLDTKLTFYGANETNIREAKTLNITSLADVSPLMPNEVKTYYGSYKLSNDISLLATMPHMHKLAVRFKAWVTDQNGNEITLLSLKKWNFDWQTIYRYASLLPLKAETIIHYSVTYDNTEQNPFNPSVPPRKVQINKGWSTYDEMMVLGLQYVDFKEGDETQSLKWNEVFTQ